MKCVLGNGHQLVNVMFMHMLNKISINLTTISRRERKVMFALSKIVALRLFRLWRQMFM